MGRYLLSHRAVADLTEIWVYSFETWSEQQADKYYQLIIDVCKEVASNPGIGRKYGHVYPGLMGYKAHQHIIFYRVGDGAIEVVRILHSKMDIEQRLND